MLLVGCADAFGHHRDLLELLGCLCLDLGKLLRAGSVLVGENAFFGDVRFGNILPKGTQTGQLEAMFLGGFLLNVFHTLPSKCCAPRCNLQNARPWPTRQFRPTGIGSLGG